MTTRSGSPPIWPARRQTSSAGHAMGGGRSAGLPRGAPTSTQAAIVAICSSVSEMSFANAWMPTVLSMCHGGISRATTLRRMARAQGRTSSYVTSDIGAICPSRWQASQRCWRIGATSLENVTASGCAAAVPPPRTAAAASPIAMTRPSRLMSYLLHSRTRTSTYAFVQQHWKPTAIVGPCGPESSHASTRST